jgi:hypothetical protein
MRRASALHLPLRINTLPIATIIRTSVERLPAPARCSPSTDEARVGPEDGRHQAFLRGWKFNHCKCVGRRNGKGFGNFG